MEEARLSMPRILLSVLAICLCTILFPPAFAQHTATLSVPATVVDQSLGISFLNVGNITAQSAKSYTLSLQSATGNLRQAGVTITVSERVGIDLSGSLGGKLYVDDPGFNAVSRNVVRVDTVVVDGLQFRREFWAVYAGMGAWEGVVNCYAFHGGQYYSVCMNADVHAGRPGEVVDGKPVSDEDLRTRIAATLSDPREPLISQFGRLVSSFRVVR